LFRDDDFLIFNEQNTHGMAVVMWAASLSLDRQCCCASSCLEIERGLTMNTRRQKFLARLGMLALAAFLMLPLTAFAQDNGRGRDGRDDSNGAQRRRDRNRDDDEARQNEQNQNEQNQNAESRRQQERDRQEELRQEEQNRQEELRRQQGQNRNDDWRRQQEQNRQEEWRRQEEVRRQQERNRNNDDWRRNDNNGRNDQYNRNDEYNRNDQYNRNRRGRNWDQYGGYGGSFQLRQTALNAGYNKGIQEGRKDRSRGDRFDYRDEGAYQNATEDYSSRLGDRELYRRYFREGFANGYEDGYRGY
jgi:flagellar biosynthesis GTPase FlhF